MEKLKKLYAGFKEKMKGNGKAALLFVAFMLGTVLFAHFYARTQVPDEVAVEEQIVAEAPPVVTSAPSSGWLPPPYVPESKAPEAAVATKTTRVIKAAPATSTAQEQRPIVIEIHQLPAPVPAPVVQAVPKDIPEHLKLTPANLAATQGRTDGEENEFDRDFDLEPEKEVKK